MSSYNQQQYAVTPDLISNHQAHFVGSSVGQRDMQLQKAELIIQIQSMAAFITNKLHEHQLMEKLDPKPSASHCQ
jgi:hypothetical protein